jgi:hypothetical protein
MEFYKHPKNTPQKKNHPPIRITKKTPKTPKIPKIPKIPKNEHLKSSHKRTASIPLHKYISA